MIELTLLLILFQIKHFLADYPLQTEYMLGKMKRENWEWPLSTHCLVHATGTFLITTSFAGPKVGIIAASFDYGVHFTVDRIKASPDLLNRFSPDNKFFWWILGLDQMLHHLTHYVIILYIWSNITWNL